MSIKQFVLGAAMLFTVSVSAQQQQAGAIVDDKAAPPQAQLFQLASSLVRYGYQSKEALPLIQALQIYKGMNVSQAEDRTKAEEGVATSTQTKTDVVSYDENQLIADATKFANGDKTLLALINDTKKSSRGAVGGPKRHVDAVNAGCTDVYRIQFRGGEAAWVYVSGDGDTDLDLYVYDANGNFIDSDTDATDECLCTFTPRWTGTFVIKIVNRGRVYNRYVITTN